LVTTDDEFPEGTLVRSMNGGVEAFKQILFKLKRFKFNGYLKSIISRESGIVEGYLLIQEGVPLAAVYGRNPEGSFIKTKEGEDALKLIWGDTYDTECSIEVRGRVNVEKLLNLHPNAGVNLAAKSSMEKKKRAKVALSWGETQDPTDDKKAELARTELAHRLENWESSGYVVKSLESALDDELGSAKAQFDRFEENIRRLDFLHLELERMELKGHDAELEGIKAMFKDPTKITAIEAAMEDLQIKMKDGEDESLENMVLSRRPASPEEKETEEGGMASQGEMFPTKEEGEKCSVCGADLHGKDTCPACGVLKQDTSVTRPEETLAQQLSSPGSDLVDEFTFDSFIVSESNRFSQAAALAVSKIQSSAYNPLFICSGAGLGKTHILNAIGNYVIHAFPEKKVIYVSMESFINDFIESTKANKMAAFRKKYRKVDFLLLDDVHFIADQEAVQDELFHTFNTLYKNGKQIVMSCDRPLREVTGLKDRLVSRFEAGLITDIQPAEFETRVAILRKKLEKTEIFIEDEVLRFIAKRYTRNIRTLEGALSTLIAYCELMKKPPSISAAIEALKEELPDTPEEPELVLVPAVNIEQKVENLKVSHSYLIEEERPVKCFELLVDNINMGFSALALSRMNPKRLRELHNVDDATILWLTDREGDPSTTITPTLEKIMYRIEDTLNAPGKSILLIDGLDYLISNNSFDSVLRFLRRLIDEVSESETIFLMSLTPETIDEQGLKILEREMEIISFM